MPEIIGTIITNAMAQGPLFFPIIAVAVVVFAVGYGAYVVATARPKAEGRVEELVQQLDMVTRQLMEAERIGHIGSFTWDFEDPSRSFWSSEMYELFGLIPRKQTPTIDSALAVIEDKDREKTKAAWDHAKSYPGQFSMVFRTSPQMGPPRYVRLQGQSIMNNYDHKLMAIRGVAHDVSKEMEVDKAKTEFVSLASHQLKTPLTSISWLAEAMLNAKADPMTDKQRTYVSNIYSASRRMVEMVNDLLNVSRIELGTLAVNNEDFDIAELLREVIAEQQHTIDEKKINFKADCGELPHLLADKSLSRMVLQNLISNAIKYTPKEGVVSCELTYQSAGHDIILIRVSDSGIGIPRAERDHIFEKLHRAQNAQALVPDGTGLGLYVVKTIVDKAGGEITFESTEGKGTTFYASFPLDWTHGEKRTRDAVKGGILHRIWKRFAGQKS